MENTLSCMVPLKDWPNILSQLETILSPSTVKTWFYKTEAQTDGDAFVEIFFPNAFALERANAHYLNPLKEGLSLRLKTSNLVVKLSVRKLEAGPLGPLFADAAAETVAQRTRPVTATPPPTTPQDADPQPSQTWSPPKPSNLKQVAFGLSPFYTFENLVVGPHNQLAFNVAQAICQNPGHSYNPFFIYAGTGLGKTHLLQAIGNEIAQRFPQIKVVYGSGESFTNELLEAIKLRSQKRFREKFRQTDVLLIDDVQFVAGKEATQEELFHAFNDLYLAQKQIVLTSDQPPREIALLEDRLRSRFAGGMIADIAPPDETVRTAILRAKRDRGSFDVSDEVLDFIAREVKTNIREMEGVFLQIVSIAKAKNVPADLGLAAEVLAQNKLLTQKEKPTPKKVISEVCQLYNLSHKDLVGHRRTKEQVMPRQICMYLLRHLATLPLTGIAQILGNRDHTTVLHGVRKIEVLLEENGQVSQEVRLLTLRICG